ncbi:MAG: N-acetylmuramoyl-L-alanine amidase [Flavobacteriaceae bacterium]|jgi:N-acetylmuramoyl-L-alanine amidase|nr:N-acetylmuramoyl-L-alanine amidase [Flavobacteriaceae bacterium]
MISRLIFGILIINAIATGILNGKTNPNKIFVVVLDAGHGGKDSGNRGNGYYEKKIALNIALKVGAQLEKIPSIKVIYTRKKDVFVDLIERANIANKTDADLFVSIHCDAFTSSKAFGVGTFVLGLHENERNFKVAQKENSVIFLEENYEQKYDGFDPNDPQSVISLILMQETYLDQSINAASTIQKSFVNNLKRKDRSVKQAGFVVLKYTYMPSVLVETGFLTNKKEGAYLNSRQGQEQMSNAIAKAIVNYKNKLETTYSDNQIFSTEETIKTVKKLIKNDIFFRVQISASKKSVALKKYNFKGLDPIFSEKDGLIYRYFYGKTSSYQEARKLKRKARKNGYKSAFIVAFSNNKKVPLNSVIK